MTLFQFRSMNESDQFDTIEHKGVLIAEREDNFYNLRLYQMGYFYVEVYHHSHFNVIVKIKSFTNTDLLEPYFEGIDIDALLA